MSFKRKLERNNIMPINHIRKKCCGKCEICKRFINNKCTLKTNRKRK